MSTIQLHFAKERELSDIRADALLSGVSAHRGSVSCVGKMPRPSRPLHPIGEFPVSQPRRLFYLLVLVTFFNDNHGDSGLGNQGVCSSQRLRSGPITATLHPHHKHKQMKNDHRSLCHMSPPFDYSPNKLIAICSSHPPSSHLSIHPIAITEKF